MRSRWQVQLGEGARLMTDSQIDAALTRRWIDPTTPACEPGSDVWTTLGEAAKDTIKLISGEYELIDSDGPLTKKELAAARPKSLAPLYFFLSLALLAGATSIARREVPDFDGRVSDALAMIAAEWAQPPEMPSAATCIETAHRERW